MQYEHPDAPEKKEKKKKTVFLNFFGQLKCKLKVWVTRHWQLSTYIVLVLSFVRKKILRMVLPTLQLRLSVEVEWPFIV